MQEIVKGYGKFIVTGLVTLTALTLVLSFSYRSSSGREAAGMMELVGDEVVIRENDVNTNRVGPEMEDIGTSGVAVGCNSNIRVGVKTRITELFAAREGNGNGEKSYPCVVTNITDEQGVGVLGTSHKVLLEEDGITVMEPGVYHFYVKVLPSQKSEVFTLCVMGEESI
ncbi:MAG: hypothetical protein PUB19_08105 [Lachnospiraceae bacterium]|nr:hypothetical protein [Lachnospiraceae bacterium]